MKQLSTGAVRREFARWLRHVQETGESITITHFGHPVAVLGPVPEETKTEK